MSTPIQPTTRYQLRIDRAKRVVLANTELGDAQALALAVQLVHELDTTPEAIR
ncbi:DUF6307 family protein [Amycolatopsis sp. NPDC051102]|jgi:hypothetical protein|uniref:DUF6307 family protein n=1 Tax=Amycolatopsis sp. NPDC051102 TaxID=3155163 RepID=UPI0034384D7F